MMFNSIFLATLAAALVKVTSGASVFYCVNAGFVAPCHLSPPIVSGVCHNLEGNVASFNDAISSFGPDAGLACTVFVDVNCHGVALTGIESPGIFDFGASFSGSFQDDISSYSCIVTQAIETPMILTAVP